VGFSARAAFLFEARSEDWRVRINGPGDEH
jgi:hypothetical protein